jgi:flagellin-like protein
MNMINKKAIAPIVATLLLIAFAVAVGIVVMNFGRAQVEVAATCAVDVGMHFKEENGQRHICYNAAEKQLVFTLENGPNIKVTGVVMDVTGATDTITQHLDDVRMARSGSYSRNADYDKTVSGDIRQLKFTPKVTVNKEVLTCTEMALITTRVPDCS